MNITVDLFGRQSPSDTPARDLPPGSRAPGTPPYISFAIHTRQEPTVSDLAQRTAQELLTSTVDWWRDAAIYQVYIRSFADGNGDGVGDIAGLRSRLPYLADLGVDALWINPWYPSPMADGGYDVAYYREIEPALGTLTEAEQLIADAHAQGIRVLLDVVINHTSDEHAWFAAALQAEPGSPERARYHFREGRGQDGDLPPNNWRCAFGGPAWTRVPGADGSPGQWYLHLFTPGQPDLNWDNPEVHAEFESILRFWFDMGVDGFRIDAATAPAKAPGLPDLAGDPQEFVYRNIPEDHPYWDRDELHEIYRKWRQIADSYAEPRVFAAEAWVDGPQRLSRYLRPDELHTAFNFGYLEAPWIASSMRAIIDESLDAVTGVGAAATWVLSNHDVIRPPSRYGRTQKDISATGWIDLTDPLDLELGMSRARAAALLTLAPPGGVLHLPRRGARPLGGRRPARRGVAGPVLGAFGSHRAWPRRMPRTSAVDRRHVAVRVQPRRDHRGPLAPPAGGMARPHRAGAGRRPQLDARALPNRATTAPRVAGTRSRHAGMAAIPGRHPVVRSRRGVRLRGESRRRTMATAPRQSGALGQPLT